MPKVGSLELFKLIKSLNKNEKRHFKIFSSRHIIGDNNIYIQLFDVIDHQKSYDEVDILKKIPRIKPSRLPNLKWYLFDLIIECLYSYSSDSTEEGKLDKLSKQIGILFKKKLFDQCKKVLMKAKSIAYQQEHYFNLLDLLRWEKKLLFIGSKQVDQNPDTKDVYYEELYILDELKKYISLDGISDKLISFIKTNGMARSNKDHQYIDSIVEGILKEDAYTSFKTKRLYYLSYGFYYFAKGKDEKSYRYNNQLVNHYENYPEKLERHISSYFVELNNLVSTQLLLNKYYEAAVSIEKLKGLAKNKQYAITKELEATIFIYSTISEFSLYMKTGNFKKGIALVNPAIKLLESYSHSITDFIKLHTYYNIAYMYFGNGQYKETLTWLNKILRIRPDYSQDVQSFARILNIITRIEMVDYDLLEYAVKTTINFLVKKEKLYRTESVMLNFMKKEISLTGRNKKNLKAYSELHKELLSISKMPEEKRVIEYFDFISWVESKVEKRSFSQILKEKAQYNI